MTEHWKKWHVSEMTREECIKSLTSSKFEFWFFKYLRLVWRTYHWNWFNIWTGEEGFWLFLKHGLREWREITEQELREKIAGIIEKFEDDTIKL